MYRPRAGLEQRISQRENLRALRQDAALGGINESDSPFGFHSPYEKVAVCHQVLRGGNFVVPDVLRNDSWMARWIESRAIKDRVSRVIPIPGVGEILSAQNDGTRSHATGKIQSGRRDRSPDIQPGARKSEFGEERVRKQSEPIK